MAEKPPELLFLLDLPSSVTLTPRQLRAERLHNDRISYVWCYVPRHERKSGPTGVVEHGRTRPPDILSAARGLGDRRTLDPPLAHAAGSVLSAAASGLLRLYVTLKSSPRRRVGRARRGSCKPQPLLYKV